MQTYGITRSESLTISTGQSFSTAISVDTASTASTFGGVLVSSADGASSVAADKILTLLVRVDGGANAEVEADRDAISMAENFMVYIVLDILVAVVCRRRNNESAAVVFNKLLVGCWWNIVIIWLANPSSYFCVIEDILCPRVATKLFSSEPKYP